MIQACSSVSRLGVMSLFLTVCIAPTLIPSNAVAQGVTADFDWSMPARFGQTVFKKRGQVTDFHWDEATARYQDSYVHPGAWTVNFDGCKSTPGAFMWEINGQPVAGVNNCKFAQQFTMLGTYRVKLTVRNAAGQVASITKKVVVKDWLIVSLGDSYASGEGNPDIAQKFASAISIEAGPVWVDQRCHRSAWSGPAMAARAVEDTDPHTSVTFLSFACSGAQITGGGILDPYNGAEPAFGPVPSQLDQLKMALEVGIQRNDRPRGQKSVKIDALIISIGGNDIGFGDIAKGCAQIDSDPTTRKFCYQFPEVIGPFERRLAALPALFDRLAGEIRNTFDVDAVYITEYPDPTHYKDGEPCGMGVKRRNLLRIGPFALDYKSALWARDTVLGRLNKAIRDAAERHKHDGWIYVGGIASEFEKHGECAEDFRWFRTEEDGRNIQGPFSPFDIGKPFISSGTLHPNVDGHKVYARALGNLGLSIKPQVNFGLQSGTVAGKPTTFRIDVRNARGTSLPAKIRVDDDPRLYDSGTIGHTFTGLTRLHYDVQGDPRAGTLKREAQRGHDIWITTPDNYEDTRVAVYVPLQKVLVRVDPYPIINPPGAKDPKPSDVAVYVMGADGQPLYGNITFGDRPSGQPGQSYPTNALIKGRVFYGSPTRPEDAPKPKVGSWRGPGSGTVTLDEKRHPDYEPVVTFTFVRED